MRWHWFCASAALAMVILVSQGVPAVPVVVGTGLAALWNLRQKPAAP